MYKIYSLFLIILIYRQIVKYNNTQQLFGWLERRRYNKKNKQIYTSCYIGHLGALCEECDIYNLRGDGHYSTSTKYSCSSCAEKDTNSLIITAISIWTLVSILISVKSTVQLLEDIALRVQVKKIRIFMSMQESHSGILIKMLTNHLQILSTITSFKLSLPSGFTSAINASGNPIQTMTYSLDCFLQLYFNYIKPQWKCSILIYIILE